MKFEIKSWCAIVLTIALSSMVNSAWADEMAIERLHALLKPLANVEATFVQHNFDGKGSILQTMKGVLKAKTPGKFRWETADPFQQLLVTDGETLWLYDQDLEQVTEQPLDKRVIATPALILSGELNQIDEAYEVYGEQLQNEWHFVLIPRSQDVLFDRLRLEFDSQQMLSRMTIKDEVGQKTVLSFRDVKVSATLPDSLFTFIAPKGVDVIKNAE